MMREIIIICALLALVPTVFCSVPVIMWNTHRSEDINIPAVPALQEISVGSLEARYFDAFKPDNVVLFLQDALSIEDLSNHADAMQHVSKYMKDAGHKLYVPNVDQPSKLQHNLIQQGYKVTKLSAGTGISELKLDRTNRNLVIVKLPPTITNPSRSKALLKADEVIQSVLSKIGNMADFTVIYTGMKSSLDSNEVPRMRVARSLSQIGLDYDVPTNYHNNTCSAVYIRNNMTLSLNGSAGPFYQLPESLSTASVGGDCHESDQSNKITYNDVTIGSKNYYRVTVELFFLKENKYNYYRTYKAEVSLTEGANGVPDTKTLQLWDYRNDSIAIGKSFACNALIRFKSLSNTTSDNLELRLEGVQIEAFMTSSAQFSVAWDCVGFFSIGVWASLLTSLLAVLILTVGLYMLADIKTMDRFDDPKGKSIMVPQSAD